MIGGTKGKRRGKNKGEKREGGGRAEGGVLGEHQVGHQGLGLGLALGLGVWERQQVRVGGVEASVSHHDFTANMK